MPLVALLVVLVAAAGCGPGGSPPADTASTEVSTASSGGASAGLSAAAQSVFVPIEAETGVADVAMRVVDLQRVAVNVVELRLELTNRGSGAADLSSLGASGGWLSESSVATADGQRRFFVLRSTAGEPVTSAIPSTLEAGRVLSLTVRFGAVPADVTTLDFVAPPVPKLQGLPVRTAAQAGRSSEP